MRIYLHEYFIVKRMLFQERKGRFKIVMQEHLKIELGEEKRKNYELLQRLTDCIFNALTAALSLALSSTYYTHQKNIKQNK